MRTYDVEKQAQSQLPGGRVVAASRSETSTPSAPIVQRTTLARSIRQLQRTHGNRYVQNVLRRARQQDGESDVTPEVETGIQQARGSGQKLDSGVRAQMEPAFGADFGRVQVHHGTQADRLNRAVRARAFTVGSDIFFRQGEYNPNSYSGRELLAHELTHVVQQTGRRQHKLTVSQPGDLYEREADRMARAVMRQPAIESNPTRPAMGGSGVARQLQRLELFSGAAKAVSNAVKAVGSTVGNIGDLAVNYIREHVRSIPGYELIGIILGRDPITQQPVERTAVNLLRGLLGLIPGGAQMFENLQQARVIERAFGWVNGELARLNLTWNVIRGLIERFLSTLGPGDALNLGGVFDRARAIFVPIVSRVTTFAYAAGSRILEFIFEGALAIGGGAAQRVLGIFRSLGATFSLIVSDPIRFLQNLINAVVGGFRQFGANILTHLRAAIFDWLFGALRGSGLQMPERFDLQGIIGVILQILKLTYAHLRQRLVPVIGERQVQILEGSFEFLRNLVTHGLSAAWERILEFAGDLVDTVTEGAKTWVRNTVVVQAIQQIASLLTPAGAVVQAIIKVYNTVMFVIERAKQLEEFVGSVVDSIGHIALGNVSAAVIHVERTLARILPLVISFLARFIGLGGISSHIHQIIQRIQGVVERALDRVTKWIGERAHAILERAAGGSSEQRVDRALAAGETALNRFAGRPVGRLVLRPILQAIRLRFQLTSLEPVEDQGYWALEGAASPRRKGSASQAKVDRRDGDVPVKGKMRFQIQRSFSGITEHLASAEVEAQDAQRGVTAAEYEQKAMRQTFEKYQQPVRDGEHARPKGNIPKIVSGISHISQRIRREVISNGVIGDNKDINSLRESFPDSAERHKEVRLDTENVVGHNLRFPE